MGIRVGVTLFALLLAVPSFGAGFYCRSTDGFLVTVRQKVKKKKYVPHQFSLSYRNRGVLLTATEEGISYEIFPKFIEYAVDVTDQLDADYITLQVGLVEGQRVHLLPGEMTTANLILWGKERKLIRMACYQYDPKN